MLRQPVDARKRGWRARGRPLIYRRTRACPDTLRDDDTRYSHALTHPKRSRPPRGITPNDSVSLRHRRKKKTTSAPALIHLSQARNYLKWENSPLTSTSQFSKLVQIIQYNLLQSSHSESHQAFLGATKSSASTIFPHYSFGIAPHVTATIAIYSSRSPPRYRLSSTSRISSSSASGSAPRAPKIRESRWWADKIPLGTCRMRRRIKRAESTTRCMLPSIIGAGYANGCSAVELRQ